MNQTSRACRLSLAGGVLLLIALGAAACSPGADSSTTSDSAAGTGIDRSSSGSAPTDPVAAASADLSAPAEGPRAPVAPGARVVAAERAVISTGNVSLRSDDVRGTLVAVQQVVDRVRGQVTERSAETEDDGTLRSARLVLRVPSASFGETMADLEEPADGVELVGSDSSGQDVTTEVIDLDVRVQVQQRSIDRIALLLDRAESIEDVVAVEAQLAQREADLGSLVQQQTYLADQTSLSTITLSVQRPTTPLEPDEEASGFRAGLSSGWDALSGVATGLLTVLGALVPWLAAVLVLAVPGVPLARRLRRRRGATPEASPTT
ncbi:MAG: DUF4349 domain-containing protein [Nocardioides sp.]|nr:DUF4349 domain-containing protein [Nocardioides sp.]